MPDVDGRFDDAEGRSRMFVRRRDDESDESFAARAMSILYVMSDLLPIELVVTSSAYDWDKLPTNRWLEARHSTDPTICLRVTILPSAGGDSIAHLVVDHGDQQVFDGWADRQDGGAFLPRAEQGCITRWSAALWRLVHQVQGVGDIYDESFERAGLMVESSW